MKLKRVEKLDLSGGVQNKTVEVLTKSDQVLHVQNGEFSSKLGAITGRFGSETKSTLVSGKRILNMFEYVRPTGERERFAVSDDTAGEYVDIQKSSSYFSGAWTKSREDLSVGIDVWAENFAGKLAVFNGVDTAKWYNGSIWEEITNAPANGKFPVVFNQKLFVLTESGFLWSSDVINADGTDFTTTAWESRGINPNEGQKVRTARRHRGRIVIFKDECIYRYDGSNEPEAVINVGTHSGKSVTLLNDLYFHHPTGIWRMGLADPELISWGVQKYLDGMNPDNWEHVAAGHDTENVYFWIGDVTISDPLEFDFGVTYTDVVLVFNTRSSTVTVYSGWNARVFYYDESIGSLYFGQADGQIVEIGIGVADLRAGDVVNPITFEVIFTPWTAAAPEKIKSVGRIHVVGKYNSDILAGSDYESMVKSGELSMGGGTVRKSVSGKEIWVGVREQYLDEIPRVSGIIYDNIDVLDDAKA